MNDYEKLGMVIIAKSLAYHNDRKLWAQLFDQEYQLTKKLLEECKLKNVIKDNHEGISDSEKELINIENRLSKVESGLKFKVGGLIEPKI